jgi:hypothetical protein
MSLIRGVFGKDSPHYEHFEQGYQKCVGYTDEVDGLKGIFRAAKADFDGGYLFTVQASISGEIMATLLALRNLLFERITRT